MNNLRDGCASTSSSNMRKRSKPNEYRSRYPFGTVRQRSGTAWRVAWQSPAASKAISGMLEASLSPDRSCARSNAQIKSRRDGDAERRQVTVSFSIWSARTALSGRRRPELLGGVDPGAIRTLTPAVIARFDGFLAKFIGPTVFSPYFGFPPPMRTPPSVPFMPLLPLSLMSADCRVRMANGCKPASASLRDWSSSAEIVGSGVGAGAHDQSAKLRILPRVCRPWLSPTRS